MKHQFEIIYSNEPLNPIIGVSMRQTIVKCSGCGLTLDKHEWYADGYWASMAYSVALFNDNRYEMESLSCEEYIIKQVIE